MLTYVLGAAEGDAGDALDAGQVELLDGLAGLLLVAGEHEASRASGEITAGLLSVGLLLAHVLLLLDGGVLGGLIGELLDTGVRHGGYAVVGKKGRCQQSGSCGCFLFW